MRKNIFGALVLMAIVIVVFINSTQAFLITKNNIDLFLYRLIPALLPAMLLIYLLMDLGGFIILGYLLQFIMIPLFNISGLDSTIIISGMSSGFPLPAIIGEKIMDSNKDTNIVKINRLIALFSFPSLAFMLNIIGKNLLSYTILPILISFYGVAFFILFLTSLDSKKTSYMHFREVKAILKIYYSNYNFVASLKNNIKKSLLNMGIILGNIILFSLILVFTKNYYILGFFEYSSAASKLSESELNLNGYLGLVAILAWGGLSVFFQNISFIKTEHFKYKTFIFYRFAFILGVVFINLLMQL